MDRIVEAYFSALHAKASGALVTDATGESMRLAAGIESSIGLIKSAHAKGSKLMVIGNGGSAAIASHMATDYTKNGGMPTQAFNDGSMLTCLGNDLGYENVFAKQIEMFAHEGDLLIAISSSGKSANILNGVEAARARGCAVITLSGFDPDNPLRVKGDVNFYVSSSEYGLVEISHMAICHAILDIIMGWGREVTEVTRPLRLAGGA